MVVRHAGQHAGLVELHIAGQLEVFLVGAYPGRHPRETVAARPADVDALAVLGRIEKEFRGRDEPALAAETVQEVEHLRHLLDRIRRTGLLPVTKGRIGDAHLLGRSRREQHVVKNGTANARIGEKLPVKLGLLHILQRQRPVAAGLIDDAHGLPLPPSGRLR